MSSSDRTCELCRDISEAILVPGSRVVEVSKEWAVVATLGPLSDHHLMLVPQGHRHFSMEIPGADAFISSALTSWSKLVGQRAWLAFEHANSPTGCGIVHAHVHLFAGHDRLSIDKLFSDLPMAPLHALSELSLLKEELFWCTSSLTEAFAVIGQKIPSQLARSRIASAIQMKFSSDWKAYTHPEWLRANTTLAREFAYQLRK